MGPKFTLDKINAGYDEDSSILKFGVSLKSSFDESFCEEVAGAIEDIYRLRGSELNRNRKCKGKRKSSGEILSPDVNVLGIDKSTVFYSHYNIYDSENGFKRESLETNFLVDKDNLLIIDNWFRKRIDKESDIIDSENFLNDFIYSCFGIELKKDPLFYEMSNDVMQYTKRMLLDMKREVSKKAAQTAKSAIDNIINREIGKKENLPELPYSGKHNDQT